MKKIDIKLLKNYINGEDLGDYKEEQLENDHEFMLNVMTVSKDYKMYNYCSNEVKKNYDFVKNVVLLHKDNIEFIDSVAHFFFENTEVEYDKLELSLIMKELLPKEKAVPYYMFATYSYLADSNSVENRLKEKGIYTSMGFEYYYNYYYFSEITLDFYAKNLIETIIKRNNINLRVLLHSSNYTKEQLSKFNEKTYILNIIKEFDLELCFYVGTHLYIIDELVEEVKDIINNWDEDIEKDKRKRCKEIIKYVEEYVTFESINNPYMIDDKDLLYAAAYELGEFDLIKKYDDSQKNISQYYDEETYEYVKEYEPIEVDDIKYVSKEIERNASLRRIYDNVKKIIENQLYETYPKDLQDIVYINYNIKINNVKCK